MEDTSADVWTLGDEGGDLRKRMGIEPDMFLSIFSLGEGNADVVETGERMK